MSWRRGGVFRKVLEILAEYLMEEGLLSTNQGSFLHRLAVTITTRYKLEHSSVGLKVFIAEIDMPKELPVGLEEFDRNR